MANKLHEESILWFEKSKSSMTLLKDYFDARLQLEEKVESMWTTFYNKWQKKFKDVEDPMKVPSEQSLTDLTRHMVEETKDNSVICCSAKSSLKRKQQNPSYVLDRWLTDPTQNTACIDIEEFKQRYNATVTNMAESEKKVNRSLQTLHEKTTALQHVVAEWSGIPLSDVNRNIAQARKEEGRQKEMEKARETYQHAVYVHRQTQQPYVQTMNYLGRCLDSYENNRLLTMQRAARLFVIGINQYETKRETRKERINQLLVYVDNIPVNEAVENWLTSLQEPCNFAVYLDDHPLLALGRRLSHRFEVPAQTQSQPQHDTGSELSTKDEDKVKAKEQAPDNKIKSVKTTVIRIEVASCKENRDVFFKSPQDETTSNRTTRRHSLAWQTGTPQVQQRNQLTSVDSASSVKYSYYLDRAKVKQGAPSSQDTCGIPAKEVLKSVSPTWNHLATKFEEDHKSPEKGPKDASRVEEFSSESQLALETLESEESLEYIVLDGKCINTDKMFQSSVDQIDAITPVEPVPKIETRTDFVRKAKVSRTDGGPSESAQTKPIDYNAAIPTARTAPLLQEAQAFEPEDNQPQTATTESAANQNDYENDASFVAHVMVCALKSYTSLVPGHLTFHKGQKIKQKMAANDEGLAYGYITKNRQRTYGLYPASLVEIKAPSRMRRLRNFFRKKYYKYKV